jgi:hypothetical protein
MLHWFFLSIKYQIWALPKDPAELRKLAIDLQIPPAYSRTRSEPNTRLLEGIIRERLKSFRKDISYILFLLIPIFSITALLAVLLVWMAGDHSSSILGFVITDNP